MTDTRLYRIVVDSYRIVVDSWPTRDNTPIDQMSDEDKDEWIDWHLCNITDRPEWLSENATLNEEYLTDYYMYRPAFSRRTYISKSSANRRMKDMREYGVVCHVDVSEPVVWKEDNE